MLVVVVLGPGSAVTPPNLLEMVISLLNSIQRLDAVQVRMRSYQVDDGASIDVLVGVFGGLLGIEMSNGIRSWSPTRRTCAVHRKSTDVRTSYALKRDANRIPGHRLSFRLRADSDIVLRVNVQGVLQQSVWLVVAL